MRRIFISLRSNKGYALIIVMCVFFLFTVFGVNTLVAASAGMSTITKKHTDSQASLLSTSLLPYVGKMVEGGSLDTYIQVNVLNKIVTGLPGENGLVTMSSQMTLPNGRSDTVDYQLELFMENPKLVGSSSGVAVKGMLSARLTANYNGAKYSYMIDFSQRPNPSNPSVTGWLVSGYRSSK